MTQVAPPPELVSTPSLKLAACVLLAGSLRPSPLAAAAGCSVLDLSLTPEETVLEVWMRHFEAIGVSLGQQPVVHVIYGMNAPSPRVNGDTGRLAIKLEEDAQQFRGPAGAVRDACSCYPGDATVIVAEAARYVNADLIRMIADHQAAGADITVACNADSTPAGLFVVRCETLELIPKIGFTDLKEQWLRKAVEKGFKVRVHRFREGHSYELRTREGFLHAATASGGLTGADPELSSDTAFVPAESESVAHAVAHDVTIGARAVVVDSVVMSGATIGADAIVARSILCPGARVPEGGTVIESVVPAGRESEG